MFEFFRKKELDKSVKKEEDQRKAEIKKRQAEIWNEWLAENPIDENFEKENKLKSMYAKAEEYYKNGSYQKSLDTLVKVVDGYTALGKVVGLYVFILYIDVIKECKGYDDTLNAYDLGIEYYSNSVGEYVDRWKEHLEVAKESYIEEEKLIERLKEKYEFPLDTPTIIALKRLENLAVHKFIKLEAVDNYSGFDRVWRAVLNEVDYFEQGDSWNSLNKTTYKGAKNWLKSFSHLCKEKIPEEYRSKEG